MNETKTETACNPDASTDDVGSVPPKQKSATLQSEKVPLFLRYSSEGLKGDAQDEKDKSAE